MWNSQLGFIQSTAMGAYTRSRVCTHLDFACPYVVPEENLSVHQCIVWVLQVHTRLLIDPKQVPCKVIGHIKGRKTCCHCDGLRHLCSYPDYKLASGLLRGRSQP